MDSYTAGFLEELEKSLSDYICPAKEDIYRALELCSPYKVKVLILGQDPYPNPDHATGIAFGVPETCTVLPPSLQNIMKELGVTRDRFDVTLESWARQGVLLLNTCLTTEPGSPGAHLKKGWNLFTELVLHKVAESKAPLVVMLWGKKAQEYEPLFRGEKQFCLSTSHPSPLSAHKGFLGCGHFDLCNKFLIGQRLAPIQWTLTLPDKPDNIENKETIYLGP